ncbi:hypothetical protein ONZ43_g5758 [Nemania bipapillata]|uniref:Uncharacterized protein n=1 Tax=Nemania bipapillata TaxID=110536 RepID=A0ACC2I6T1_9PEZI|nr:hypothetical protein ONZ43_g5758 [Nemania bipapillata]
MPSTPVLDIPRLDSLPTDILFIILGYLDTARSVARLAAVSKSLHQLISAKGWHIFVKSCFNSLTLPTTNLDQDWVTLARVLTSQSRDWDRRAFVFYSLSPPDARRSDSARRGHVTQSIPGNIIVDAHLQRRGRLDEELVIWGSGEDVIARVQRRDRIAVASESWYSSKGSEAGFVAGKGDTTAISIVKPPSFEEDEYLGVLVGRANGDLRLLSTGESSFGSTLMHFRPPPVFSTYHSEIRAIDVDRGSSKLVAGTRESVWLYPIRGQDSTYLDMMNEPANVDPITHVSLKEAGKSSPFDSIRSAKMLNQETIAVALSRSFDPIRVLSVTPTGLEISTPARTPNEHLSINANPRTVRALLPVDVGSVAGGGRNVLLSSWDDGTIRLQDLRTPSTVDRVYQDNFEVTTPINALISHGLERFVAGSAYSNTLKVFDFRWAKGYYHTDSLPCSTIL